MNNFTKNSNILTVILNWNGTDDTLACLESLKNVETDIYLLDNASKPEELKKLKDNLPENILLIENEINNGFVGGNNQGIKYALENNYEYVLLLNNDTEVKECFLKQLLTAMEEDKKVALDSPKIYYYDSTDIWHKGGKINKWTTKTNGFVEENIDFLSGCCLLMRVEALKEIGDLDKRLFAYCEDMDISQRALKAGWKLKYVQDSVIWHKVSQSTGGSPFKPIPMYLRTRNRILYQKKHGSLLQNIFFFFYHTLFVLFFFLFGLIKNRQVSVAVIKGYLSGYVDYKIKLNPNFPNEIS